MLSPNTTDYLLCVFSCEIMLSASTWDARKVFKIFPDENIYEPVIKDYILWVVIVGLPTLDFARNVLKGYLSLKFFTN